MPEKIDKIFDEKIKPEDFEFSSRVVEVFDDMLDRSIPHYKEVIHAGAQILGKYLRDNDSIYDLGSSTGTTLLELSRLLEKNGLRYFGIDSSEPMLDKARLKAELYSRDSNMFKFLKEDITQFAHNGAGAVMLNYTLQFIRPLQRENLMRRVFEKIRPGGVLLLSEKTINHDKNINRDFIDIYHQFKKQKGYSELEISQKREALENVLIPFSIDENKELLKKVGFQTVETYFQWFNFSSILAIKK
ncbi:MAG: carboxy-S-adenosyl-L-methionine synthase CmoA [Desulfotalea sp.]